MSPACLLIKFSQTSSSIRQSKTSNPVEREREGGRRREIERGREREKERGREGERKREGERGKGVHACVRESE